MKAKNALKFFLVLVIIFVFSGIVQADYNSTVYTPNFSAVSVVVTTYELTTAEINASIAWTQQNYPNATMLRNPSRRYNCHSYAWYSQSTGNYSWMNSPGDDAYWLDGSYTERYFQISGYKISYSLGDHSGIFDLNGYVISKWGARGLMKHYWNYCPYVYILTKYYSR